MSFCTGKLRNFLQDLMLRHARRYTNRKYRMLAFWDKTKPVETLVIATHGFVKKTQKTPQKEIDKAIAIRNLYFGNE